MENPTERQGRIVEDGKLIPIDESERRARSEAFRRLLADWAERTDEDPPEVFEEMARSIDEGRPHRRLFEGMY